MAEQRLQQKLAEIFDADDNEQLMKIPGALVSLADGIRGRPPVEANQLIEQIIETARANLKTETSADKVNDLFQRIRDGPQSDEDGDHEHRAEPVEGSVDDSVLIEERLPDQQANEENNEEDNEEDNEEGNFDLSDNDQDDELNNDLEENADEDDNQGIPDDNRIVTWLRSAYQAGGYDHLVIKQNLVESFYEHFNLTVDFNHHTIITKIGRLVHQTFPRVKEARPGTAGREYRPTRYRYLRLRTA